MKPPRMKNTMVYLLLACLLPLAGLLADTAAGDVEWNSYDEALQRSKDENKKIFLNFYASWCRYCKAMDQQTFTDPSIVGYLNDHFISVKVNVEKERDVAALFRISPLPDTWFVAEDGEPIGNRPGFLKAEELLPILKFIQTDSYLKMSYADFLDTL